MQQRRHLDIRNLSVRFFCFIKKQTFIRKTGQIRYLFVLILFGVCRKGKIETRELSSFIPCIVIFFFFQFHVLYNPVLSSSYQELVTKSSSVSFICLDPRLLHYLRSTTHLFFIFTCVFIFQPVLMKKLEKNLEIGIIGQTLIKKKATKFAYITQYLAENPEAFLTI